jgi:DNA-binding HxlR family transcriptional regulator
LAQGLLLRTVLPCVPPAVEYRLSASGAELANLLGSLYHFGVRHLNQHTRYAA